jgi:diguanylate cyclase (GGDEF)-like protein
LRERRGCVISLRLWPKPFKGFEEVTGFLISLIVVISLFISTIFIGIYLRSNGLLLDTVREQARSYFELIVQTRLWNAQYGSVYVEKKAGVQSNPYLRQVGIEPDVTCEGDRKFTMRNPALMTREISLITGTKNGVKFHITSLKPLNPENAPDSFEQGALHQFDKGVKEVWLFDRGGALPVYRYMAPLIVEHACIPCHQQEGYREGEVRGGISVTIPLAELDHTMATNKLMIIALSVLTIFLLIFIVYIRVRNLVSRLRESQRQLEHMSVTDELTGLRNRRYIMERLREEFQRARREEHPLGLIVLDLDLFKKVNDTYGHGFGDTVLKTAASRMKSGIREYDLLGRIGGEEFLIVAPDSAREETVWIAERVRDLIKGEPIGDGITSVKITISAGVTILEPYDQNIDVFFSRADNALYLAKEQGRDRVAVL